MLSLSNFFLKFKNIEKSKNETVSKLSAIVNLFCGFPVSVEEVLIEKETVSFIVSPLKRNEIFMHKAEILEKAKSLKLNIVDIR